MGAGGGGGGDRARKTTSTIVQTHAAATSPGLDGREVVYLTRDLTP